MYKNFTAFIWGKQRCCKYNSVLIIKLTLVLITATFLQASAITYAQGVTIKAKQATLKEVFEEIRDQTKYDFLYNSDDLKLARPVTLDLKNVTINQAMDACLNNQSLTYSIDNKTILIRKKVATNNNVIPPKKITGRVVDIKGLPLPTVKHQGKR